MPREETLEAFRAAFASLGFVICDHAETERGYDADATRSPLHAARQLPDGLLTSKLGAMDDIEHPLTGLEGREYGRVALLMKRPLDGHEVIG